MIVWGGSAGGLGYRNTGEAATIRRPTVERRPLDRRASQRAELSHGGVDGHGDDRLGRLGRRR